MVQGVLFDLDGTLLDTLWDLAAAGNHALAAMGLPGHPVQAYRQMVGNGIPKLVERMLPAPHRGPATQALALRLFLRYYDAHKLDHTAPYAGVAALLAGLQKAGVRLGVVSNKDDAPAKAIVEHFFPGVFGTVRGRLDGTPPKPDPALVEAVLAEWGLARERVMYVGDSGVDITTAHNAGLAGCGVLWGFRTQAELDAAGADFLAADVLELARALGEYEGAGAACAP